MNKSEKLIILAVTCLILFGGVLVIYAVEASTTTPLAYEHIHDES